MKESALITWHRKKWTEYYPTDYYHKIQDALGLGGQKPFDVFIWGWRTILGVKQRKVWAKEFKVHKSHHAFSLRKIEPHQVRELEAASEAGAKATVFIGVRFLMDVDTQVRLGLRKRRISVDIEVLVEDIVKMIESGKKSIPVLPYILRADSV